MLTAIAQGDHRSVARYFLLRGVAWSLALFGVLRLSWFELHAVLPLTQLQARLAVSGFGTPALPIDVTLACSGADALALCAGSILAYPAPWRLRLGGAAAGTALILALNTVRIGTLGRAAGSPSWFEALHVLVWPAVLTLAVAGYVFAWMRFANGRQAAAVAAASQPTAAHGAGKTTQARPETSGITARFVLLTAVLLVLFVAASPLYLESGVVLALAAFIARAAALTLGVIGVEAVATANVLSTARGAFLVTQECISTPLIPVYVAAVLAYATTWRAGALAVLAAAPLFVALGVARLLVVAIPAALVGSPLFFIHAFYQLLLAGVVVVVAAIWRHGAGGRAWRRALLGAALGVVCAYLLAPMYARVLTAAFAAGPPLDDPQGAIALLPAFQVGLFVALVVVAFVAVDWRRCAGGLAVLALSQAAALFVVQVADRYAGLTPHVRDVRAWALAAPLLVIAAMVLFERRRASADGGDVAAEADQASWYRRFWAGVGERFPDLGGAASTDYYAANEQRLFTEHLAPLAGLKILKTDLWDEAKNTRILAWASKQGGHAYGIDISAPTVIQARTAFTNDPLRCAVSDVRTIPFRDASFDAIYSMGTIEHFDETEQAVAEMARVLKPGGRAIVGVPNRHDPFLRPLLAAGLQAMGWYAYGLEKSYSRRALREMLERAGLTVVAETAILFIPGWLRMLDLVCHSWCRPLTRVTRACVWPFVVLDHYVPAVRPHGYMLATVVTKAIGPVNGGQPAS